MSDAIPLVNLHRQHQALKPQLMAAAESVIDRNAFILGQDVADFEKIFANTIGAAEVVGCSNGTAALALALEAVGVEPGDEVITVSHTFIATGEAIAHVGATPVFVDVDPDTYTMNPESLEKAIGPQVQAVVPVHLYGTPADMDAINEIACRNGLKVVEDAAQAHLATYGDRMVGTLGDAASFSFYPGKNLGAMGDAGAVATNDPEVAQKARLLRDHGRTEKYTHEVVGYNRRMDGLQGAFLSVKLPYLVELNQRRQEVAAQYDAALSQAGFHLMKTQKKSKSVYHLYVVQVSNRDEVLSALKNASIGVGIHYPTPLHQQPAFQGQAKEGAELPVTEEVASRIISLPICGYITEVEVEKVKSIFFEVAKP